MLFAFFLSLVCLTAIHDTDRGLSRFKAALMPTHSAFNNFRYGGSWEADDRFRPAKCPGLGRAQPGRSRAY
jgi:hypothetical protein